MALNRRLRWQIFRRDKFACGYCGLSAQDGAVLEVDHIHPRAEGGSDDPSNLITACSDCNSGKSDMPLRAVESLPKLDLQGMLKTIAGEEDHDDHVSEEEWIAFQAQEWEFKLAQWLSGFEQHPGPVAVGKFLITVTQAELCGLGDDAILEAARAAGKAGTPNILDFFEPDPEMDAERFEAYAAARYYLDDFIAAEVVAAMRRASDAKREIFNTFADVLIEAAEDQRRYVEEHGRDFELLKRWLDRLPWGDGSKFLVMATAEWDEICRGRVGHAALECRDEVIANAVRFALNLDRPDLSMLTRRCEEVDVTSRSPVQPRDL